MASAKDRIRKAFPVFSKLFSRPTPFIRETIITGAVAGDLTVSAIKKEDQLVSVLNMTDLTDLTAEFSIPDDGKINNTGGTSTATKKVKVLWLAWTE